MKAVSICAALLAGLASLAGCQREDLDEPLKLSGKVFIFNYRVAEATYVGHHKKKIAFLFSAMRHFAEELREKGFAVRYVTLDDPEKLRQVQAAQAQLGGALGRLMVVSERYPDLKSNQNFLALQSQLEGTENRIAVARKDFIAAVQRYNTEIRTFPGRLWHSVMYSDMPLRENFEATSADADKAPEVKF